jgi:hypothetical protein
MCAVTRHRPPPVRFGDRGHEKQTIRATVRRAATAVGLEYLDGTIIISLQSPYRRLIILITHSLVCRDVGERRDNDVYEQASRHI